MDKKEHKQRHIELHKAFDELLADFILHNEKPLSKIGFVEFLEWSYKQSLNPTEIEEKK